MARRQAKRKSVSKRQPPPTQDERKDIAAQALQIRVIIHQICMYLCFEELKEFRLINKMWKQVITAIIRKRVVELDFTQAGSMRPIHFYTGLNKTIRASKLDFPCEKFCVGAVLKPADQHLEDKLLQAISGFVKELKFEVRSESFQTQRKKIKCPKLTTICLKFDGEFNFEVEETIANYFQILLQSAPELKTLALNFNTASFSTTLLNTIESAKNIKILKIGGVFRDKHLQSLAGLGLKLNTLVIDFKKEPNFCSGVFACFLETQSKTLEELRINNRGGSSPVNITFPKLKKLLVLELGSLTPNTKFPGLCYATQFPVLKSVVLRGTWQGLQNVIHAELKQHKSVETLEMGSVMEPEMMIHVARVFPDIKKLKLTAGRNARKTARMAMKNLEEFTEISIGSIIGGDFNFRIVADNGNIGVINLRPDGPDMIEID